MSVRVVKVDAIDAAGVDRMFALFRRYYSEIDRARFERDLRDKDEVIVVRHRGELVGFSTLRWFEAVIRGRRARVVFSGDTVVDRARWGTAGLHWGFLFVMLRGWLRAPFRPLYWFLISKGYRTYLLLANNFAEHFPRYEQPTPPDVDAAIATLSRRLFGGAWDDERRVLDFGASLGQLRPGVADPVDVWHPRVRFFVSRNPTWWRGTELPCLARFTPTMLLRFGLKRARRRRRAVGRAVAAGVSS